MSFGQFESMSAGGGAPPETVYIHATDPLANYATLEAAIADISTAGTIYDCYGTIPVTTGITIPAGTIVRLQSSTTLDYSAADDNPMFTFEHEAKLDGNGGLIQINETAFRNNNNLFALAVNSTGYMSDVRLYEVDPLVNPLRRIWTDGGLTSGTGAWVLKQVRTITTALAVQYGIFHSTAALVGTNTTIYTTELCNISWQVDDPGSVAALYFVGADTFVYDHGSVFYFESKNGGEADLIRFHSAQTIATELEFTATTFDGATAPNARVNCASGVLSFTWIRWMAVRWVIRHPLIRNEVGLVGNLSFKAYACEDTAWYGQADLATDPTTYTFDCDQSSGLRYDSLTGSFTLGRETNEAWLDTWSGACEVTLPPGGLTGPRKLLVGDDYSNAATEPAHIVGPIDGVAAGRWVTENNGWFEFNYDWDGQWHTTAASVSAEPNEPTGFRDRTTSTMAYDRATNTFSLSPTGSYFVYDYKGHEVVVKDPLEVVIDPETSGAHYIYIDASGVLAERTAPPIAADLLRDYVFVCFLYLDNTAAGDGKIATILEDERHGPVMDWATHLHLHRSLGTQRVSGLGLGDFVIDGNGTLETHAQLSVTTGVIADEDIIFDMAETAQVLTAPAEVPILYMWTTGGDHKWHKTKASVYPVIYDGTTDDDLTVVFAPGLGADRGAWNQYTGGQWVLTEISANNRFSLMHFIAIPDVRHPIMAICGQAEYQTITAARQGALTEVSSLITAGLPVNEYIFIGTIIVKWNDTYANVPKCAFVSTDTAQNYVSWLEADISAGTAPSDHNNLTSIGTLSHTQIDQSLGVSVDALAGDTGAGTIYKGGTGTLTAGKLYYLDTDSAWKETDATDDTKGGTGQLLGIAKGTDPAVDGMYIAPAFFHAASYLTGHSPGKAVWMSETAGEMTCTKPSTPGNALVLLGHCTATAEVIRFLPGFAFGTVP